MLAVILLSEGAVGGEPSGQSRPVVFLLDRLDIQVGSLHFHLGDQLVTL